MAQIAVANDRRWGRGAWLTLAGVVAFALLCALVGGAILAEPGDGCQFVGGDLEAPRALARCFGDWPTPLRAGDRIVAVAGAPLEGTQDDLTLAPRLPPPGWTNGGQVRYTVLRAGQSLDLDVPLGRLGLVGILRAFGTALEAQFTNIVLPLFLGALVILCLAPRSGAAQLLVTATGPLFAVTTFIWAADSVADQFVQGLLWMIGRSLAYIWGWQFVPTVLLLVLSFPRPVGPVRRWPAASAVVIYGLGLGALAVTFISGQMGPSLAFLGVYALLVVASATGITLRTFLRGRDPVLRAQTAWMALGVALGFAWAPLRWALVTVVPGFNEFLLSRPAGSELLETLVMGLAFPLCMGIAITRYRLFDIDLIIRRTLIYSALTALLALTYFGLVIVLQGTVTALGGARAEWVTVASTLAVAALIAPLRGRVQRFIDRRFYRRKYDAARTLAEFAAVARDETDLEALTGRLVRTVQETLQPESTAVWLKPPGAPPTAGDQTA